MAFEIFQPDELVDLIDLLKPRNTKDKLDCELNAKEIFKQWFSALLSRIMKKRYSFYRCIKETHLLVDPYYFRSLHSK